MGLSLHARLAGNDDLLRVGLAYTSGRVRNVHHDDLLSGEEVISVAPRAVVDLSCPVKRQKAT